MNAGKVAKWTFLGVFGLLAGAYAVFWLYFTLFPVKPPDVFNGIEPDLGVGPDNKVMSYVQSSMLLGNTDYEAMVGMSRYCLNETESWDYFFCWVHKKYFSKTFGESQYPFFERWIPTEKVPADLWNKDVQEIVSYDPATMTVTFNCGFTNFVCTLPPD